MLTFVVSSVGVSSHLRYTFMNLFSEAVHEFVLEFLYRKKSPVFALHALHKQIFNPLV